MLEQYSEYKDSGIDWLGKMPSHWGIIRSRFVFDIISGNGFSDEFQGKQEGEYPFYKCSDINSTGVFVEKANNYVDRSQVEENSWNIVPRDSILLAKIGESLKKNHRKISRDECLIDNNMMALALKHQTESMKYYYYLMCLIRMEWFVNPGAVPSVDMGKFRSFGIPNFIRTEQEQIEKFLDSKTIQIDELIVKKERMIDFLKEERAAVINQAMTKGLDPKVEMKDSGISWMGKIPKHWNAKRLKYLIGLINEDGSINGKQRVDLENIESWTGRLINIVELPNSEEEIKTFSYGDVLFNKLRPYLAKVFLAKQEGVCGGELLVLRPKSLIDSRFLFYRVLSESFISVINGATYGTKMPRASWDFIGSLVIPYPDRKEQSIIADYLDRKIDQIDEQTVREAESIELLKEYRTVLISEAVTGKIDVRESR